MTPLHPFIAARNFTRVGRGRRSTLIVIHTMESQEKPGTARAVAQWFAGSTAPKASAHFCVDSTETIQCVSLDDVAWHAPGVNSFGIGIEHAGRARQTAEDWADEYSTAMLERSAQLAAELCRGLSIPVLRLTVTDLQKGATAGFCGHADVSLAFNRSTHTDPGKAFPWESYLARVAALAGPLPIAPWFDLRRGDNGERIRDMQRRLNELAQRLPLNVDGDFGKNTEAAVVAFQHSRNLVPTGVVDEETWRALEGATGIERPT